MKSYPILSFQRAGAKIIKKIGNEKILMILLCQR